MNGCSDTKEPTENGKVLRNNDEKGSDGCVLPGIESSQGCRFNSRRRSLSFTHTHTYVCTYAHTRVKRLGGGMCCRLLILHTKLSGGSFITGLFQGGQTREKSILHYSSSVSLTLLCAVVGVCTCASRLHKCDPIQTWQGALWRDLRQFTPATVIPSAPSQQRSNRPSRRCDGTHINNVDVVVIRQRFQHFADGRPDQLQS